jgi:hypothetical protein
MVGNRHFADFNLLQRKVVSAYLVKESNMHSKFITAQFLAVLLGSVNCYTCTLTHQVIFPKIWPTHFIKNYPKLCPP